MQTRSFRGSGEPAWVIASSHACFRLGPDPRRALGPAAIRAASTGRTHDRTRPMLHQRKKALVNQAPSTHDGGLNGSTQHSILKGKDGVFGDASRLFLRMCAIRENRALGSLASARVAESAWPRSW